MIRGPGDPATNMAVTFPSIPVGSMPPPSRPDPSKNQTPRPSGHPFLTERGLRLQMSGRVDYSVPQPLPTYPPTDGVPVESWPIEPSSGERIAEATTPVPLPAVDPFDTSARRSAEIFNVVASKSFADPAMLANMPLDHLHRTSKVPDDAPESLNAVGKLFIQTTADPLRPLASGSAWIIGPSTLATAAHNLYDHSTGRWSRRLQFHAGFNYYDPPPPTHVCEITSGYLPRRYLQNPSSEVDFAILYTDCNIGDAVGHALPWETVDSLDAYEDDAVAIVGYPATSGFDFGKQMWRSVGSLLFGRFNRPGADPSPVMASAMGAGASGGPWIIRTSDGALRAIGVTSGHAKLRHVPGEHNLASLTSPMMSRRLIDELETDAVHHTFATGS